MASGDDRYARQRVLPEIGDGGQEKLSRAKVVVIGCGALGSAQAGLLARAGIGHIKLVDRDVLELNNLQRQVLYTEQDVAEKMPKALAAAKHLTAINSQIQIDAQVIDLHPGNIEALIAGAHVVLDGTDNFETRYLINDACVKANIPWIYGGVIGTSAMALAIVPGRGPCLRCVFPDPPPPGTLPTCDTAGVLNTAPGLVACLQVTEAFYLILQGPREQNSLISIDLWLQTDHRVAIQREHDCPCCGKGQTDFLDEERTAWTTSLCGRNTVQISPAEPASLDLAELASRLEAAGDVKRTGYLLELKLPEHVLVIFPDGRALVQGTQDQAEARTIYARYLGT